MLGTIIIWALLTGGISSVVGAAIVLSQRRQRLELAEREALGIIEQRLAGLGEVAEFAEMEERMTLLRGRLDVAEVALRRQTDGTER